jgi:hypothetical protein
MTLSLPAALNPFFSKSGRLLSMVLATLYFAGFSLAQAPGFISFEAPGAGTTIGQGTVATKINANGLVAGHYVDSAYKAHGFLRSVLGQITEFDAPGLNGTLVSGLNNSGQIIGNAQYLYHSGFNFGFLRNLGGSFAFIRAPGAINTFTSGINDSGEISGFYTDAKNEYHAFVRGASGDYTVFDEPDAVTGEFGEGTFSAGVNGNGEVVGSYNDAVTGQLHGYLRDSSGNFTSFDAPGGGTCPGCGTAPIAINRNGEVGGNYTDSSALFHSFFRDSAGNVTDFDVPGATETYAEGFGDNGEILGEWTDGRSWYGFTRDASGSITTSGIFPFSISDAGTTTGYYDDGSGRAHGFLY